MREILKVGKHGYRRRKQEKKGSNSMSRVRKAKEKQVMHIVI